LPKGRHATFGHFEAGRRKPSFDNVGALAKALDVTANFLLGTKTATTAFGDEAQHSPAIDGLCPGATAAANDV